MSFEDLKYKWSGGSKASLEAPRSCLASHSLVSRYVSVCLFLQRGLMEFCMGRCLYSSPWPHVRVDFTPPGRQIERRQMLICAFGNGLSCEQPVCEKFLDYGPGPSRVTFDSSFRRLSALRSFELIAGIQVVIINITGHAQCSLLHV